ncbi:MAG: ATP-binding protein [Gammaproteobacteria bacterium]|nr:ATP-binding protein [Gammaproteobacteria bacterium]
MGSIVAGVTLHIDENTTHEERENFRNALLGMSGVMAAAYHDDRPHLMVIIYDPALVKSIDFVNSAKNLGLHSELIA